MTAVLAGSEKCVPPDCETASWQQSFAGVRAAAAAVLLAITAICSSQPAAAGFLQQGSKLVGIGYSGAPDQGYAIALSADGNSLIVGAPYDNSDAGAAWVYVRKNGVWTQQGTKLVGANGSANALQGVSVALSADGNTAIIGGQEDNQHQGAAWVFTRSNGTWTQQGAKLVGNDSSGSFVYQGSSVALSGDGNTAIVGGPDDNSTAGAAWIYKRSNGVWTQQGAKLVAANATQDFLGFSVALSTDGNTAIVCGSGAIGVFTRSGQTWSQHGNLLIGSGAVNPTFDGWASAISGDGKTILMGGQNDNNHNGAAWVFTLSNGTWAQQGNKLTILGSFGTNLFGSSVALSADGNTAVLGSPAYGSSDTGAAWIFSRISGTWFQVKGLLGTGYSSAFPPGQGQSVSISADGDTVASGGSTDNTTIGAAWLFTKPAAHDFDASGESDIVWRQTGGNVAVWLMKNASVLSSTSLGIVPTKWSVVGQHDFDGDGNADLLWRDTAGNLAIWFMQGNTVKSSSVIGNVPITWSLVALGDFNDDGKTDILWRNANGDVAIWLMNGAQVQSTGVVGHVPNNWSVAGADRNGNIFWRDNTAGTVAVWAMSGFQVVMKYNFGSAPSEWSIVGLGDFDGNGMTDILWRDSTTGAVAVWLTKVLGGYGVQTVSSLGTVPSNWSIVATGDFDGDGKSDILWHDANTGTTVIWFVNGTQVSQSATVGTVGTNWTIQGANAD
jgi:hypothetical protein